MYIRYPSRDVRPQPPPDTYAALVGPHEVAIGDLLLIQERYHEIGNMRSVGLHGHKLLFFETRGPWLMEKSVTVHRFVTRPEPGLRVHSRTTRFRQSAYSHLPKR